MYKNINISIKKNNFHNCLSFLLNKKNTNKKIFINKRLPIAIYGFGNLGKMALRFFEIQKIKVDFIVDRNINSFKFQKGYYFRKISYLNNIKKKINLVICIGDKRFFKIYNKYSKFKNLNCYHFYDFTEKYKKYFYLSNGWKFNVNKKNKINIIKVFNILSDFRSKLYYLNFLLWHSSRSVFNFININLYKENKYFIKFIRNFLNKNDNVILDVGSYHGDYFKKFLKKYKCKSIVSVEADKKNILCQKKIF